MGTSKCDLKENKCIFLADKERGLIITVVPKQEGEFEVYIEDLQLIDTKPLEVVHVEPVDSRCDYTWALVGIALKMDGDIRKRAEILNSEGI